MKQLSVKQHLQAFGLLSSLLVSPLYALDFISGSDGSDGVLNITSSVEFSELTFPSLDSDGDGIYHFTTINVASGAVVTFSKVLYIGRPVYWLASGDVNIAGEIDLDGESGLHYNGSSGDIAKPGPGGFAGGSGLITGGQTVGQGPGAGEKGTGSADGGGGGGYFGLGSDGYSANNDGPRYGNAYLLPLLGGSGGGGAYGSGGAGAGAILIASSTLINLTGAIHANGGNGGSGSTTGLVATSVPRESGGGGSGGAIRLMADNIMGNGTLSSQGGGVYFNTSNELSTTTYGIGGAGFIKLEAYENAFSGTMQSPSFNFIPGPVFLDPAQSPVRVVSIGGVAVPASPHARITAPDVVINSAVASTIELEAHGIPLGTTIELSLIPVSGDPIIITSTALTGTLENSTATASVTIPYGFSHFYVETSW